MHVALALPLLAAALLIACAIGFVMGVATCSGSGFPHVDALAAYVRLHVVHLFSAREMSHVLGALGIPLQLTSDAELAAISSVAVAALAGVALKAPHMRVGRIAVQG